MLIDFALNGAPVRLDVDPATRLVDVLTKHTGVRYTRAGCYAGECGACIILLDDSLVHGCLIPMFLIRNRNVTTIEGISSTRTYRELKRAFDEADYYPCQICNQSKYLSLYRLLETTDAPVQAEIDEVMLAQRCRCTDHGDLQAILNRLIVRRRKRQRAALI